MVDFLRDFIHILRSSDLRVSTSESIDAMNVVSKIGFNNKSLLRDSLSFSLAKTLREKEIFNECFDNFFKENYMNLKHNELPQEKFEEDIELEELNNLEKKQKNLEELYKTSDKTSLMTAMALASRDANLQDIKLFTQVGMFTRKIFDEMGLETLNNDIFQASRQGNTERESELKNIRESLRLEIRDYVENQVKLRTTNAGKQLREDALSQMRLTQADKSDYQIMSGIIKKMARRLISVHSRRKRKSQRGMLDIRSTIRANQEYDGILFETIWKKTKVDRPKIVALCDVSGSVANYARFMLMFLYSLEEVMPKVRSFAFSSDLAEVTDLFERNKIEDAISKTLRDYGGGSTDYGQAFLDFRKNCMDDVDNRTTIIILGDARNNYGEAHGEVLKEMYDRCKRLIWLNPESRISWSTGDSEMRKYMAYSHQTEECNSLMHLERVVGNLLKQSN